MFARFSFLRLFKCPLTTSRKSRMDWNIPQTKSHHKGRPFENLENNTERYGEGLQTYEHNSFSCLASFKNGYAYAMISQHTLKISTIFYLLSYCCCVFSLQITMLWRRGWCFCFVCSDWEALVCLLVFQSRFNTQQMYFHRWISFKNFDFIDASHWRTGAFPWKVKCVEYSNLWKVFTSHLALTTLMNQKLATRPMIANTERKTPWGQTSLI